MATEITTFKEFLESSKEDIAKLISASVSIGVQSALDEKEKESNSAASAQASHDELLKFDAAVRAGKDPNALPSGQRIEQSTVPLESSAAVDPTNEAFATAVKDFANVVSELTEKLAPLKLQSETQTNASIPASNEIDFAKSFSNIAGNKISLHNSEESAPEMPSTSISKVAEKVADAPQIPPIPATIAASPASSESPAQSAVPVSRWQSLINKLSSNKTAKQAEPSREEIQDKAEATAFRDQLAKPLMSKFKEMIDNGAIPVKISNTDELNNGNNNLNLGTGMAGMLGGILGALSGIIVGTIGGSIVGIVEGYGKVWSDVAKSFKSVGSSIKTALSNVFPKLSQKASQFAKSIGEFGTKAKDAVTKFAGKIKSAASTIKSALSNIGSTVSKGLKSIGSLAKSAAGGLGKTVAGVGKSVGGFFKNFGAKFAKFGKGAFSAARTVAKKIPQVQAITGYASTLKNAYDTYKKTGNLTNAMTLVGGGTIDTLLNATGLSNVMGAVGAVVDGKGLKGAWNSFLDPTQGGKKVSYGMGVMSNIQNLVGNETELTRALAKASNNDLDLKDVGVKSVGGIAGFTHAGYEMDKTPNVAAGSTQNNNTPNASTVAQDEISNMTATNESVQTKAIIDGVKEGFKAVIESPEYAAVHTNAAKASGTVIQNRLVHDAI